MGWRMNSLQISPCNVAPGIRHLGNFWTRTFSIVFLLAFENREGDLAFGRGEFQPFPLHNPFLFFLDQRILLYELQSYHGHREIENEIWLKNNLMAHLYPYRHHLLIPRSTQSPITQRYGVVAVQDRSTQYLPQHLHPAPCRQTK